MKNTTRASRNYVLLAILLQGFLISALLVSLKILTEHTFIGHRPELFTFGILHSLLAPFNRHEELAVVVVDVSNIKEKNGQIIDLAILKEITAAIAEQKPRAIAIDAVLNPKDIANPRPESSTEPTVQQVHEYYDFLDFCLRLQAEKNVPIFLAVGMMSAGKPEEWLGQEKYKGLAATALLEEDELKRIAVWLKAGPTAEKLFSLSASLARAYRKPRLPEGLSWAIETTGDGLPATQSQLDANIEYAYAQINYNTLGDIQRGRLLTLSRSSVNEAGEKFHSKMVLLGDGASSHVYVHACGANTFARAPLYEMKLPLRLVTDICLLLVFGGVVVARYRRLTSDRDSRTGQDRNVLIVGIAVLLSAVGFVYWIGLLWLDFLLVAVGLWLHPRFEKSVQPWSKRQPVPLVESISDAPQGATNPKTETRKSLKRKILFIAANPTNASRIQTDKEHRVIKAEMERGSHRDAFEFLPPQFAVTITELLRAMNTKPNIVHFSGHGETGGIVITRDDNQSQLLTADILERLFKPLKGVTEIVVLNSCYSASQAESISKLGMYVVGNNLPVGDQAAISFAKGLYNGLSEGKSFEHAINDARIVVMTESASDSTIVELWEGGNKLHI